MSEFRWWHLADCREIEQDVFFDETPEAREIAKRICGGCGVRKACRDEALATTARLMVEGDGHLDFGFQGGLSVEERQRIVSDLSQYSGTHTDEELQ